MLSDAETERLIGYLVAKSTSVPDLDVQGIVATTVLDTLLVAEGSLTVDDFAPREMSHG